MGKVHWIFVPKDSKEPDRKRLSDDWATLLLASVGAGAILAGYTIVNILPRYLKP